MTTATLALLIFASILAQVAGAALVGLFRRRRQFHALASRPVAPTGTAVSAEPGAALGVPQTAPGWDGFRELRVERRVVEDRKRSVCSFHLVPADGQALPPFRPGQYLTFKLRIADPATGEVKTVVRCYSLSDRPRPDHYRVSVKRVPPPADQPNQPPGTASNFFHDQVRVGARLWVKAPAGQFYLRNETLPVVLIGGGIGITPMLSMLNSLLESGDPREVWLYYGVRNGDEQVMKAQLRMLATRYSQFNLHICYSDPDPGDVEGRDYQHRGRIDIALLRATLKLRRYQFYVCGPRPLMETLVPALEDWGVASDDIHYESFGPATLIRPDRSIVPAEGIHEPAITVSFSRTGKRLHWNPAAGSLLAFAEANGIAVESGCRAGSCGSCQTAVESGKVLYLQQPDAEVKPGHCLLCISTPKGDLTLGA
jgi:ferredoxin-NADP reductase